MNDKRIEIETLQKVFQNIQENSDNNIGKIALYLWYFQNINPNDNLTQYINLLARYAFIMGVSLAKDFNRECVSANLAKMRNTFEFSKDLKLFSKNGKVKLFSLLLKHYLGVNLINNVSKCFKSCPLFL